MMSSASATSKYQPQDIAIVIRLVKEGSKLLPDADPLDVKGIIDRYTDDYHKSTDVHHYLAERELWRNLWGEDSIFPGIEPKKNVIPEPPVPGLVKNETLKDQHLDSSSQQTPLLGGAPPSFPVSSPSTSLFSSNIINKAPPGTLLSSATDSPAPSFAVNLKAEDAYTASKAASQSSTSPGSIKPSGSSNGQSAEHQSGATGDTSIPHSKQTVVASHEPRADANIPGLIFVCQQAQSQYDEIMEHFTTRPHSHGVNWKPRCGWNLVTGRPNYSIRIQCPNDFRAVSGPNATFANEVNELWGGIIRFHFQKFNDHLVFQDQPDPRYTLVWLEFVGGRAYNEPADQVITEKLEFLKHWVTFRDEGGQAVPINLVWAHWSRGRDAGQPLVSQRESFAAKSWSSKDVKKELFSQDKHPSNRSRHTRPASDHGRHSRGLSPAYESRSPNIRGLAAPQYSRMSNSDTLSQRHKRQRSPREKEEDACHQAKRQTKHQREYNSHGTHRY